MVPVIVDMSAVRQRKIQSKASYHAPLTYKKCAHGDVIGYVKVRGTGWTIENEAG